jgi:UDP-N-acetylenolpyruvoylglucosamine reductase
MQGAPSALLVWLLANDRRQESILLCFLPLSDELLRLVSLCAEQHWPLLIVGNGSNTVFTDAGVRGVAVHMALGILSPGNNEGEGYS